jgi:formyltetrahydrofolate deformylase
MRTLVLLFQCNDQRGIVAGISDFIFRCGGNIITADQHSTDPENGHFFLRVEFYIDEARWPLERLRGDFSRIGEQFKADWRFYNKDERLRMGIFVSRTDHCLVDLLYLWRSGELKVDIPFVLSDHEEHKKTVELYGIPFHYIPASKDDRRERELLSAAKDSSDFLVFARFMLIVSGEFINGYGKDIINIHHSFLPSFKGANPYKQAYERGVKVIGATAHYVTEKLDEGPIISQMVEHVSHKDSVEALVRKGRNLEKRALSQAVSDHVDYRITKYKNRTIVF